MSKQHLEDMVVGERLVTSGRTITETDILTFAGLTGDFHPLHTDATYAATTRFGTRIAHGQLVLAVGSALSLRPGLPQSMPDSFIAFYGMDRLRFPHPVKIGDTIRFESTVTAIDFKDEKTGIMTREGRVINQNDEVCCAFISKALCGRRPAVNAEPQSAAI